MSVKAERAARLLRGLRKLYPDAHCELDYATTKTLFKRYKTVDARAMSG